MAIHLFKESGGYTVWTDCEPDHTHSGRCIGMGETVEEAKADAVKELQNDLAVAMALTDADVTDDE